MTARPAVRLAALPLVAALVLGGCSDNADDPAPEGAPTGTTEGSSPAAPTATIEPYLDVPKGVELTLPGTTLEIGDAAVVAWQPRKKVIHAARVRVTGFEVATQKVFKTWELDKRSRKATPYFVRARVTNVGRTDLGGALVPLYGQAPDNVLLSPSRFEAVFEPCPQATLPKKLPRKKSANVCMVYLAPDGGAIDGVSFYQQQDGFKPVVWQGKPAAYKEKRRKKD